MLTREFTERAPAACGVGIQVNLPHGSESGSVNLSTLATHETVLEGLQHATDYVHRSGRNPVTHETDGAGITLFGIPTAFFQREILRGTVIALTGAPLTSYTLTDNHF